MRNSALVALVAVSSACGGASPRNEPEPQPQPQPQPQDIPSIVVQPGGAVGVPLADAIASGAVTMSARGAGVDRVELVVQAHADVSLVVPSGTYFRGQPDGGFQNMIVTKTTTAQLVGGSRVRFALPTACTNFHRAAPSANNRFVLAAPEPALHRLVTCLEHTTIGDTERQAHVWRLTDNVKREDLKSRRDLLRPRLVDECRRRLRRSVATCESLVDAVYEATVDKLFERSEPAYAECLSPETAPIPQT